MQVGDISFFLNWLVAIIIKCVVVVIANNSNTVVGVAKQ